MRDEQQKNDNKYQEREYWQKRQDDITIIYLDTREQAQELAEIEEIEQELGLHF